MRTLPVQLQISPLSNMHVAGLSFSAPQLLVVFNCNVKASPWQAKLITRPLMH